jgi:hypothetical protein
MAPRVVEEEDRMVPFHGNLPAWLNEEMEAKWVGVGKPFKDRTHLIMSCVFLLRDLEATLGPLQSAVRQQLLHEMVATAKARMDPKSLGAAPRKLRVEIKTG